jgi:membrane protein required for colicin V production
LNGIAAFACAFLVVLVLWGLGARAVAALVGKTLLRPLDRLLGAVFGLARGLLVLLALAMAVSFTPASASPAWRESQGAGWLNSILRELLPSLAPMQSEPGARSV